MFEPIRFAQLLLGALTSDSDMHGTAIDLGPYINVGKREAYAVAHVALTSTTTDNTVDIKLQESDGVSGAATTATSDWSDISGASFTQTAHNGSAFVETFGMIKFLPTKRFLNCLVTLGGTSCAAELAVAALPQGRYST